MKRRFAILCLAIAFGACAEQNPPSLDTVPISAPRTPDMIRVERALASWPKLPDEADAPLRRPFFTTIHVAGRRVTASGYMQYYGARDFRVTAVTEMGAILFDGRVNWAGVTVLRSLPGIDKSVFETILADLSRAFELPADLNGLSSSNNKLRLSKMLADTHKYIWTFDPASGRLKTTDVELGLLDTLHIEFRSYDPRGWPEEVAVTRKARLLEVIFSFTDNHVVQRDLRGNAQ